MNTRQIDEMTMVREFNSIGEFVEFITNTPLNKKYEPDSHETGKSAKNWTLTSTYDEALNLLLKGWTNASEKMTKALSIAPKPAMVTRQRSVYSVAGHSASVPRYLQGVPTNMISSAPDRRKQPVVTINHSITYASIWKAEDILNEGIKALQVVQAIEASNRNVKLNIVCIARDGATGLKRGFKITIKQPGERLNISKMAFPLAHPSMIRRIFFRYMEVEPDMPKQFPAYGKPCSADCEKFYPNEFFIPERVDVEKIFSEIS